MCKNTEPTGAEQLKVEDEWIKDFDVEGFTAEIKALGDRLERGQGMPTMYQKPHCMYIYIYIYI